MKDYVKPCIRDNDPEHIFLHAETNDLNSKHISERMEKSSVDLANSLISEKKRFTISGMIPRIDEWNDKMEDVNSHLTDMCKTLNSDLIDNKNFTSENILITETASK